MTTTDLTRIRAAVTSQEALLVAVAEGRLTPGDADPEYRRLHTEIGRLVRPVGIKCFCPWSSVHQWHGIALADRTWRETLEKLVAPFREQLVGPAEAPSYQLRSYRRGGDPRDMPFTAWVERRLPEHKHAVLREALRRDLAHRGSEVTSDTRTGRTIPRKGRKVIEYKIQRDVKSFTGAFPTEDVSLRVFFTMTADGAIMLLHGYDKGADPSERRQEKEIDEAFKRLNDYLAQEARLRKEMRRRG